MLEEAVGEVLVDPAIFHKSPTSIPKSPNEIQALCTKSQSNHCRRRIV